RIHRLEGDDLALLHGLFAEAARHAGERVVATASIAFGVDQDVTLFDAGTIDHSMGEVLERGQDLPLLADHASRIRSGDLDVDLRIFFALFGPSQTDAALHLHVVDHGHHELERLARAFVVDRNVVFVVIAIGTTAPPA